MGTALSTSAPTSTVRLLLAPAADGYWWGNQNRYDSGYVVGRENGEDEDPAKPFHELVGSLTSAP